MNTDYCYCKGHRCELKEHCVRYVEGKNLPKGDTGWWWMDSCDEETREAYVPM